MLNEKKVRLMTRLAMYESKEGPDDLKINTYDRRDYTSFQTIITILWITVGYVIVVGGLGLALLEKIMAEFNLTFIITLGIAAIAGYLILIVVYGITASRFYGKKHDDARKRVKIFQHDLTRLNKMYERER